MNRGVPCRVPIGNDIAVTSGDEENIEGNQTSFSSSLWPGTQTKCCSGLCVDLLRKFQEEIGFSYDLVRVADPKWGTLEVKLSRPTLMNLRAK